MANQAKAEEAVREAITRANDLGYHVQLDNHDRLWNVWLRKYHSTSAPDLPINRRLRVLRSEIVPAIHAMLDARS